MADKVLVIDDDRSVLRLIEKTFDGTDTTVLSARTATEGVRLIRQSTPDVLLLDIMLPEANGLEVATQIKAFDAKLPIVFITAMDDSDTAIQAIGRGAFDYLLKPLDKDSIIRVVERAMETRRLMQSPVHLHESTLRSLDGDVLIGRSAPMLEVYKQIGRVAPQDVAVLLRGESGTGKELVARAIYQHSRRNSEYFMAINCAALSDTLLESELFGHEKGAFTGAERRHVGKFEHCHGGTIFLDEIGDMSPTMQSKVLRLVQQQKFERVGGTESIETNVRIISATNRDLVQMIANDEFRLDLYHRLNAFEIFLPPLRDRGPDILLLIEHFLAVFNRQLNKNITSVSTAAMELLTRHPWPGNIRELQAALRKAVLTATSPVLLPDYLPDEIAGGRDSRDRPSMGASSSTLPPEAVADFGLFLRSLVAADSDNLYSASLQWMERHLLTHVLSETRGNLSQAARQLGITRQSLRNKIQSLNIVIESIVSARE